MTNQPDAASLLRSVGLLADGPTVWGRPVPAQGPGVFVIELPEPRATAPIELTRVGKWIERVDGLRMDGARPTSRALAARLASFWLPTQTVLYIGTTDASIGRRVAAIGRTELGDRRPHSGAHWLKTLRTLDGVRIWWTLTNATEEYEDALLAAFAGAVPPADLAALPDRDVVLPWANLRRPTGERKATGLSGSLLVDPTAGAPAVPTFVVQVPDGDADGANGEPPESRRRATVPRTPRATPASRPAAAVGGAMGSSVPATPPVLVAEALTADGAERLRAELEELTQVKRREVIARIRTAKEHGDLKENSDYHAAREEQSFLEGRVQAIEARLRSAVIVDAPVAGSRVGLGSVVTLDDDGETVTYTIVGADESDPKRGRISSSSPVGNALVGRDMGDFVVVQTPAGERRYRILEIG
jgi:transcription elongation factor GreA